MDSNNPKHILWHLFCAIPKTANSLSLTPVQVQRKKKGIETGYAENPRGWNPFTACLNIPPCIQFVEQR